MSGRPHRLALRLALLILIRQLAPAPRPEPLPRCGRAVAGLDAFEGLSLAELELVLYAELCRRDFYTFFQGAWTALHDDAEPFEPSWVVKQMCDHAQAIFEGRLDSHVLIANVPPSTAKSLVFSVAYPAWVWLHAPYRRFLCITAVEENVKRDSLRHRKLVGSDWYQQTFAPDWKLTPGEKRVGMWSNSRGGERLSRSTGQQIIGAKGTDLIIDDPLDPKQAHFDRAGLQEHVDYYNKSAVTRVVKASSPQIIVMQRLHEQDLSGVLIEEGGVEHLCIPLEFDGVRRSTALGEYDPRIEEGELLPRFTEADVAYWKKRLLDQYSAQFNQRPTPVGGLMFKEAWIEVWAEEPACKLIWLSVDTGFKAGKSNDFTVVQAWGAEGLSVFLLAQARGIWDPPEMIAAILDFHRRAGTVDGEPVIRFTLIENKAAGPQVIKAVRKRVKRVIKFTPDGDSKEGRAAGVTPLWADHRVHIPKATNEPTDLQPDGFAWVRQFRKELLAFPLGRKDQVDAMSQSLIKYESIRHKLPSFLRS